MIRFLLLSAALPLLFAVPVRGQTDDTGVRSGGAQVRPDTTVVQDGIWDRPFIGSVGRTAIGGYMEGNTNSFVEGGIPEGFSFELRRFNIFLYSTISERVRFLSELEFEHGTEEIALETALVDFEIHPALKLRAGIILPPIGSFNTNHDSPKWEFVERPLVATEIIPSTLSEAGFGVHGQFHPGDLDLTYDAYMTNGLGEGVVLNGSGRTRLADGKGNSLFAEDNNGSPAFSARIGVGQAGLGEVGISHYRAVYNTFDIEGDLVDEKRQVRLWAFDYAAGFPFAEIKGELALAEIDVPESLQELFGERQWGGHVDFIVPVWRPDIGSTPAVLNLNLRLEHVDLNAGTFSSTGRPAGEEITAVVPGIGFRPTPDTIFRLNYVRRWHRDLVNNAAVPSAGVQFGVATYF